jgi:CDP-diacylglycerol---serine O-phosphatidyltransferase
VSERAPRRRLPGGLTLRALVPNAITAAGREEGSALAVQEWKFAITAIVVAGVLDGIDGRIARLLKAQSRFGAELDSLADNVSFGVAPALVLFMWSLQDAARFGWFAALAFAVCMALRLARFNARIDLADEPRKEAGFLTGVPAPVGAGLVFLPMYLWFELALPIFKNPIVVAAWLVAIALLLISAFPTLSWSKLRPRKRIRLELIALVGLFGAALITEPWYTFIAICAVYLASLPLAALLYARVKRQRALRAAEQGEPEAA